MTHSLTNHDIANLRHQERVALGHAAIHALEAREARSTQRKADSAAEHVVVARPRAVGQERNAADAGARDQLTGTLGGSCLRARRTLSLMLDGEGAATDVARVASHVSGCERCGQFAAAVAAVTQRLRTSRVERPRVQPVPLRRQGNVRR